MTASWCCRVSMAEKVIEDSQKHAEWEVFSPRKADGRRRPLQRYYPLHEDAEGEYEEWKKTHGKH